MEDCKHTVEFRGLEQWINQNNEEIVQKQCPRCKMPILKTLRFKNHVKTVQKDICKIETKLLNGHDWFAVDQKKATLERSVQKLNRQFDKIEKMSAQFAIVKKLWFHWSDGLLQRMRRITLSNKTTINLDSWTSVTRLAESFFSYESRIQNITDGDAKNAVIDHFFWLMSAIVIHAGRLSKQQTADVNLEMARGARLVGLAEVKSNPDFKLAVINQTSTSLAAPETVVTLVADVEALLTASKPYHQDADNEVQRLTDRIRSIVKSLVAVTDAERKMIHAAMLVDFYKHERSQGHWLKCANGHIYCVTECGGPMQRAKCPECKEDIGGVNHSYVEGTSVATEMDGATNVAWSDVNNMQNYG